MIILILFLSSIGTLFLSTVILFPVVSKVNKTREQVLSLFLDIPIPNVKTLYNKCEKFVANVQDDQNDDIDSNDDADLKIGSSDDTLGLLGYKSKKNRKFKNSAKNNRRFFIKFLFAIVVVEAYFIYNFVLANMFVSNVNTMTTELNVTSRAEPYFSFALNVQREMFNNPNLPIYGSSSFDIAKDTILEVYDLNSKIQEIHIDNEAILDADYNNMFAELMTGDCCSFLTIEYLNGKESCESFASGAPVQGMHTVLVRYFETLRNTLSQYQLINGNSSLIADLYNSKDLEELYIIQQEFIEETFRLLNNLQKQGVEKDFEAETQRRLALFICFIIILLIAFLTIWTPFVNKLNKDIWRTKSMLTIIPIEVILKIKSVQKFLHSQSFFTNKAKKT